MEGARKKGKPVPEGRCRYLPHPRKFALSDLANTKKKTTSHAAISTSAVVEINVSGDGIG